jgi:predicted dehydrogenase
MNKLNWGIIGLGNMAHEFAESMVQLKTIYAVASRDKGRAESFKDKYNAKRAFSSYEDLLKDEKVDIIYIATVNEEHYVNIMAALEKGKHVLCEKAIWGNYEDMQKAVSLAESNGLFLGEAMTIYHMPIFNRIKELINKGHFGKVKFIEAELGSLKEDDPSNRFFSKELGGGAMLDIGTYALSFVVFFLTGKIIDIKSTMCTYPTGVDEMWGIVMKTDDKEIGSVNLTFRAKLPKRAIIAGEKAYVTIDNYVRAERATIVYPDGKEWVIEAGETAKALQYEIENIEKAIINKDFSQGYLDYTMKVVELMDKLLADSD